MGKRADLVVLDSGNIMLNEFERDAILDALVLAAGAHLVKHVMVGGNSVVQDHRHHDEEDLTTASRKALQRTLA